MTDVVSERDAWVAAKPFRSPEQEQAKFGGDVPAADELALEDINPYNAHLFHEHRWHDHFARLRREDPVHFNELGSAGRYWSVTTWEGVRAVDGDHDTFSSAHGITLTPPVGSEFYVSGAPFMSFIAMDPPEHGLQRKTVRGAVSTPSMRTWEPIIRERTANVLDSLPEGETFDWVDTVSIELTTLMLATLFDFPLEDRRKLTFWSDATFAVPQPGGIVESQSDRRAVFMECIEYFERLFQQRRANPGHDLVSMLAHGEATKDKSAAEHLGNLLLLIVGGNDTTRNTMSGSVYGLNRFPAQYDKLIADPSRIASLVPEMLRWQTPLAYMRRTANHDTELMGREIKADDQVLMWYVSANRDETVFGDDSDEINLDRPNSDRHVAFGHGIHRCMGSRLAELQLRVLWEELLPRFERVELMDEPTRTFSSFVNGYTHLPVRVTRRR